MGKVKKFFVVSDIHGCATVLKSCLRSARFEKNNPDHILLCLGDCFDRGYENVEVLEMLESIPNKIMVKGNHEDLLEFAMCNREITEIEKHNGTDITIKQFFGDKSISLSGNITINKKTEMKLINFISGMVDFYETKNYIFVHGWIPCYEEIFKPKIRENWRNTNEEGWKVARFLLWHEMYALGLTLKDKTIVCGHSSCEYGRMFDTNRKRGDTSPYKGNGVIAIDANVYRTGKLNIIIIEDEIMGEE